MGTGVSSLRLRKAIVIRAFNLRRGDETLEEQFKGYAFLNEEDGRWYISLADVKACLCLAEISWAEELIKRHVGEGENARQDVLFSEFVDFLETGQAPSTLRGSQSEASLLDMTGDGGDSGLARSSSAASAQFDMKGASKKKPPLGKGTPAPGRARSKERLPPHPPRPSRSDGEVEEKASRHEKALKLAQEILERDNSGNGPDNSIVVAMAIGATSLIPHPRDAAAVRASPSSSVWRKRELVRQERTVQYTTIDANGALQELVEKETSETEVLHMESRETGEFAHRETTVYEHKETFNDEVVGEQHGVEEYVHLKSVYDEFEYMESTMPKKQAPQDEEGGFPPQSSPRLAGEQEGRHPEDLDEEMLAFLQYQELQQQYELQEQLRRQEDGGNAADEGGPDDEDDLPRSWWQNHAEADEAAEAVDLGIRPSHLDQGLPVGLNLDDAEIEVGAALEAGCRLDAQLDQDLPVQEDEVATSFADID